MKIILHNSDDEIIKEISMGSENNFERVTSSIESLAEFIVNDLLSVYGDKWVHEEENLMSKETWIKWLKEKQNNHKQ